MKIRECKALARETLLGKYGTVILAYLLSGVVATAAATVSIFGLYTALKYAGALPSAAALLSNASRGRLDVSAAASEAAAGSSLGMTLFGVLIFTIFLIGTLILGLWLGIGQKKLLLNICRGERYGVGDIFYGFKGGSHPLRVIWVRILTWIFEHIPGLIPMIVLSVLSISGADFEKVFPNGSWFAAIVLTCFVFGLIELWLKLAMFFAPLSVIDRPETGAMEAIRHSLHVTRGRKLRLFWLGTFSFLFWFLLISVCRLAALWVMPYMQCAVTIFYLDGDGSLWQVKAANPIPDIPPVAPTTSPEPAEQAGAEEVAADTFSAESTASEPIAAVIQPESAAEITADQMPENPGFADWPSSNSPSDASENTSAGFEEAYEEVFGEKAPTAMDNTEEDMP